jgi:hypothetical protein
VGREIDRQKGHIREARINQIFADMPAEDGTQLRLRLDDLTDRIQRILRSNGPGATSPESGATAGLGPDAAAVPSTSPRLPGRSADPLDTPDALCQNA